MQKPVIAKLPTSQMLKFLQVFGLPQGGDNETKENMIAALEGIPKAKWDKTTVAFKVDQLD
jgi:hypothetical protein